MMATVETAFEQAITPVTHDLGDFKVNRTLPARKRTMVGPFIFVDEFGPARLPAGRAWTFARIRTSISRPSLICSTARSSIATASASHR